MMENLTYARWEMALSLGFHIIFAAVGVALPFFMVTAHFFWLRGRNADHLRLTQAWLRGFAIFFATGAVSGTVLSFELGLLWPKFMEFAGPIFGMPFALEGTAFFLEAIALGLFLYGWKRLKPWVHWGCGVVIGLSGVLSALFVVCANAWMNQPTGFTLVEGKATDISPLLAMFNSNSLPQGIHMVLASFEAVAFAVAGIHAFLLLKRPHHSIHARAIRIALGFGVISALIQPLSGDLLAKNTARVQPLKLAAMEAHFHTQTRAPLLIGGIADVENQKIRFGFEIPPLLSILAHGDPNAEVLGLNEFKRELWPPINVVHLSFQGMVMAGMWLVVISLLGLFLKFWKRDLPRWWLWLLVISTPMGFIALELGWVVTEVGRQPWIIYNLMLTKDAVTPMPGLWLPCLVTALIYLTLVGVVTWLMTRQIRALTAEEEARS